jgi:hypothetical protein
MALARIEISAVDTLRQDAASKGRRWHQIELHRGFLIARFMKREGCKGLRRVPLEVRRQWSEIKRVSPLGSGRNRHIDSDGRVCRQRGLHRAN